MTVQHQMEQGEKPILRSGQEVQVARYRLTCKTLPRLEDTIRIGNLFRLALMSLGPDRVPQILSGKDERGCPLQEVHQHSLFLPEDADGDSHIDHLLFYSPLPVSEEVVQSLCGLRGLCTSGSFNPRKARMCGDVSRAYDVRRWPVILEGIGTTRDIGNDTALLQTSRVWISCTPYYHPWFRKKHGKFGPIDQIRHETRLRGLPDIVSAEVLADGWHTLNHSETDADAGEQPYPFGFELVRSGHSAKERIPDRFGRYIRIMFAEPVTGPVVFGYGCHYGLGLFRPE